MSVKVLLADDSSTIQKVIRITLANEPYVLTEATTEVELFSALEKETYSLVLLDANLSESLSGYELSKKVKEISARSRVLLMFGTFDNVDEALLKECGASDKVIKPFDSNRFISTCRLLVEEAGEVEEQHNENVSFEPEPDVIIDEEMVERAEEEFSAADEDIVAVELDRDDDFIVEEKRPLRLVSADDLNEEWEDISVPGVIGDEAPENTVLEDLPPVIDEVNEGVVNEFNDEVSPVVQSVIDSSGVLPEDADLEFPDEIVENSTEELVVEEAAVGEPEEEEVFVEEATSVPQELQEKVSDLWDTDEFVDEPAQDFEQQLAEDENKIDSRPRPQFVSLEDLNDVTEDIEEIEEGVEELEQHSGALEDLIADEEDEDDSWDADEGFDSQSIDAVEEPQETQKPRNDSLNLAEMDIAGSADLDFDFGDEVEDVQKQAVDLVSEEVFAAVEPMVREEVVEQIVEQVEAPKTEDLAPMLERLVDHYVREYCKESIEKVAWKIIPDLAEKIIKEELSRLAQSIVDDNEHF